MNPALKEKLVEAMAKAEEWGGEPFTLSSPSGSFVGTFDELEISQELVDGGFLAGADDSCVASRGQFATKPAIGATLARTGKPTMRIERIHSDAISFTFALVSLNR